MYINQDTLQTAVVEGVIDLDYHDRLLADLDRFTQKAGILPRYVVTKLSSYCSPQERNWIRHLNLGENNGLIFIGNKSQVTIENKMMAMAGAFLRNYINAEFMPLQKLLWLLKDDETPECKVLLIPNFCIELSDLSSGAVLPAWQIATLLGLLYSRLSKNQHTVLAIDSWEALEEQYGKTFVRFFKAHYCILDG